MWCRHNTFKQMWSTVYDAGPTLNQHWLNVSCLLGMNDVWLTSVVHLVSCAACSRVFETARCGRIGCSRWLLAPQHVACYTQQTRGVDPMVFKCWADVEDGGQTLKQHWVHALCPLGWHLVIISQTTQMSLWKTALKPTLIQFCANITDVQAPLSKRSEEGVN